MMNATWKSAARRSQLPAITVKQQPGNISTQLHQGIAGSTVFALARSFKWSKRQRSTHDPYLGIHAATQIAICSAFCVVATEQV